MDNPLQGVLKVLSNAKARMIIIALLVVIVIGVVIGVSRKSSTSATGNIQLSGIPSSVQSVPGSAPQNDQYLQTLLQANQQAAQDALKHGTTQVSTLIATPPQNTSANYNAQLVQGNTGCSCCCQNQGQASEGNDAGGAIAALEAQGKISPVLAGQLQALQAQNLSPEDYAAKVQELVKEGKLSPEAAQQLIDAYNKGHSTAASPDDVVSQLAASGDISPDTAQALKNLNGQNLSPEDYANKVNELVREGKLSPEAAQALMQAYQKAHGSEEAVNQADNAVDKLLASGSIDPATAAQLHSLNQQKLTPAEYAQRLNDLVKAGKLTPEQARALLAAYKAQTDAATAAASTPDDVVNGLLSSGAIDPVTAKEVKDLNAQGLPVDQYAAKLQDLVRQGKLTPEQAKQLLAAYQKNQTGAGTGTGSTGGLIDQLSSSGAITPEVASQLKGLSSGQLSPAQYQQEIEKLVAEGKLTPSQARQLISAYKQQYAATQGSEAALSSASSAQQADASSAAATIQAQQAAAQAMQAAVENQARQLITSWNAPSQKVVGELVDVSHSSAEGSGAGDDGSKADDKSDTNGKQSATAAPTIRAGDIMFGVLETAVNSDQPGPIMASIVSGKYKGAKLLGGLSVTPDSEGVILNFTTMTMPSWKQSVSVNAVAIDPDTARTALATNVNHHYLVRFGSVFAASFLQGIGNAVLQSGSTSTNNAGTVTNVYQKLGTRNQVLVGLGQVGQSMGSYVQQGLNRKPTVTVKSGTGIGMLYLADVVIPDEDLKAMNQQ